MLRLMLLDSTPSVRPRSVVSRVGRAEIDSQRVYYLSLEFLMGRTLDNAVLNLGVRPTYETALQKLGFVCHTENSSPLTDRTLRTS